MRITLDSNAWETIFDEAQVELAPTRSAFANARLKGFICAAGFQIEAIRKADRPSYFAQPHASYDCHGIVMHDRQPKIWSSLGPDDSRHPGIPPQQRSKLDAALRAGVKLIRGGAWIGLPSPPEIKDPGLYEPESERRQQREVDAFHQIELRGVGKAAFDAADGWQVRDRSPAEARRLSAACAEWADAETVSAHIAISSKFYAPMTGAGTRALLSSTTKTGPG